MTVEDVVCRFLVTGIGVFLANNSLFFTLNSTYVQLVCTTYIPNLSDVVNKLSIYYFFMQNRHL